MLGVNYTDGALIWNYTIPPQGNAAARTQSIGAVVWPGALAHARQVAVAVSWLDQSVFGSHYALVMLDYSACM